MKGMDGSSGKALTGIGHLRQSVTDILTTPLGSRVMRRDYGSRLFDLLDAPMNKDTLVELYAATAEALDQWEPRLRLERVIADQIAPGKISITLEAIYLPDGKEITLEGILV